MISKSNAAPLAQKLKYEELQTILEKGSELHFSMKQEIGIMEGELQAAGSWDRKFTATEKPFASGELHALMEEARGGSVRTSLMEQAAA